jgi:hypothetical protein
MIAPEVDGPKYRGAIKYDWRDFGLMALQLPDERDGEPDELDAASNRKRVTTIMAQTVLVANDSISLKALRPTWRE